MALKPTRANLDSPNSEDLEPKAVAVADFDAALARVTPSITTGEMRKFEKFAKEHARV